MKAYFEKYRMHFFLITVFVFLFHGAKLHSGIIGIDTEDIIHIQNDFYGGWLNTGRPGLVFLKWITGSLNFQPYTVGLLTLILFSLAVSGFFLLLDKVSGRESTPIAAWIAGGLFLITHPVITEQFYFSLQSAEICIGLCLSFLSLYFVEEYHRTNRKWKLIFAVVLAMFTFSLYQAFTALFIFGTVAVLLVKSIGRVMREDDCTSGELLRPMYTHMLVFAAAFLLNTVITGLFFSSSDYLENQVCWGKQAVTDVLRNICAHVGKVVTGYHSVHFHISFGLLCLLCLIVMTAFGIALKRSGKKTGTICVLLFYLFALFVSPFLMTIVCGGAPAVRSQLILPFITGLLAYLTILLCRTFVRKNVFVKKVVGACIAVVCVWGIYSQANTTMGLYYTEEICFEQDVALGRALIKEIDRTTGGYDMPVVFIGRKPFAGNNACVTGEMIGKSFFDHDVEVEPKYYWSTRRILGLLHVLGKDYEQVADYRYGEMMLVSLDMPCWPSEGSIKIHEGLVVVKLSEIE